MLQLPMGKFSQYSIENIKYLMRVKIRNTGIVGEVRLDEFSVYIRHGQKVVITGSDGR